jgi:hypothetical protein
LTNYRRIFTGHLVRQDGYIDQPYIVVADDGTWVCVATVCETREGVPGQHVVSSRSVDPGSTWEAFVDIERPNGPVSSWGMPFLTPYGRIYTFNADNIDTVESDEGPTHRLDGSRAIRKIAIYDTYSTHSRPFSDRSGRGFDPRFSAHSEQWR